MFRTFFLYWTSRGIDSNFSTAFLKSTMPPKKAKYPCGTCSESAYTNALLCNFCDMWHHAATKCIPWHTKEAIGYLMEAWKEQSCWTCQKCTGIMKKMSGRLAALRKEVKSIKDTVSELQTKQETTNGFLETLQSNVRDIRKSVEDNSDTVSSTVLS